MWAYDAENPNRIEHTPEQIRRTLARHCGFTGEEMDFIINYDIEYWIGREDQEGRRRRA